MTTNEAYRNFLCCVCVELPGFGWCYCSFHRWIRSCAKNHRIVERMTLEGTYGDCLVHPTFSGPCLVGFLWMHPRMETPQPCWATWASAQSPFQWKSVSWCWGGISCISVCICYLLLLLDITKISLSQSSFHPPMSYLYRLVSCTLRLFFSRLNGHSSVLVWQMFQGMNLCDPLPDSPVCSCLCCTGKSGTGPRGLWWNLEVSPVLTRKEGSPSSTHWQRYI